MEVMRNIYLISCYVRVLCISNLGKINFLHSYGNYNLYSNYRDNVSLSVKYLL